MEKIQNRPFWTLKYILKYLKFNNGDKEKLDKNLSEYKELFCKCYSAFGQPNDKSRNLLAEGKNIAEFKITDSMKEDAYNLSKIASIDEIEAFKFISFYSSISSNVSLSYGFSSSASNNAISNENSTIGISDRILFYLKRYFYERRILFQIIILLFNISIDDTNIYNNVAKKYVREILIDPDFVNKLIDSIDNLSSSVIQNVNTDNLLLIELIARQRILEEELIIRLIFIIISTSLPVTTNIIRKWFTLLSKSSYLTEQKFISNDLNITSIQTNTLLAYTTILSIELLNIQETDLSFLDSTFTTSNTNSSNYLSDPSTIQFIHNVIFNNLTDISIASPLFLAWSIILHRISQSLTDLSTIPQQFQSLYDLLFVPYQTPPEILASRAINFNVFDTVLSTFTLINSDVRSAALLSLLLRASVPFFTLTKIIATAITTIHEKYDILNDSLYNDMEVHESIILAKGKFPFIAAPLIKLLSASGRQSYSFLKSLSTYMHQIPKGFKDYEFSSNDSSIVILKSNLCVFPPRSEDGQGAIYIPADTIGKIIPSSVSPPLVMWEYEWDGWTYIGRLLEQTSKISLENDLIIDLINLITSAIKLNSYEIGIDVMQSTSELLFFGDIFDIIARIFEDSLQLKSIDCIITCLKFLSVVAAIQPVRVWSFLARSHLFENKGYGGLIPSLLTSVEISNGDFSLTIEMTNFFAVLVKDAISGSITNNNSSKIKSGVLYHCARHFIDVFSSFSFWRYNNPEQRMQIAFNISSSFKDILYTVYSVDDTSNQESYAVSSLFKSAKLIADSFLFSESNNTQPLEPIFGSINTAMKNSDALYSGLYLQEKNLECIKSLLRFATILIKVRSYLKKNQSYLEKQLFLISPTLVNCFSLEISFDQDVIKLLSALLSGNWANNEVPSLLAYLNSGPAYMFVTALCASMNNEFSSPETLQYFAEFLSTVVNGKQEGFAILLLTGHGIGNTSSTENITSLLDIIKRMIDSSKEHSSSLFCSFLESLFLAKNSWTVSVSDKGRSDGIWHKILQCVSNDFSSIKDNINPEDITPLCYKLKIASFAAELCALEIFKTQTQNDASKKIIEFFDNSNQLLKIAKNIFQIRGYRPTLHTNLQRNIEKKWPGFGLQRFRKSMLVTKRYGVSYTYDVELMDKLFFSFNVWEGYRKEVTEANLNLSLIDAEISLIKSWVLLIDTIVKYPHTSKNVQNMLAEICKVCLQINLDEGIKSLFLEKVYFQRLELSFLIANKLATSSIFQDYAEEIFQLVSSLICSLDVDLPKALHDNNNQLYRPLLRLLALLLHIMKGKELKPQTIDSSMGMFGLVVAHGFKILVENALSDITKSYANDMTLIISILRGTFSLKGINGYYPIIAAHIAENNTANAVMSLYSYSDRLLFNDDYIYGELSSIFLVELASVRILAEQLAIDGVFSTLVESFISVRIQKAGIDPVTQPRLQNVWYRGILPLMLALVNNIGARIAYDVVLFLGFFEKQIEYTFDSWVQPKVLTLGHVYATVELIALFEILNRISNENSTVVNTWRQYYDMRKIDISEGATYLLSHPKYLASRTVATNAEENRLQIIENGDSNQLVNKVAEGLLNLQLIVGNDDEKDEE